MEERLDDAIHVLRTHAEGSLPPGLASSLLSAGAAAAAAAAAAAGGAGVQGVSYSTSVGSSVPSVVQPMEQMQGSKLTFEVNCPIGQLLFKF